MTQAPTLSVVIPCFNEEHRLALSVNKICQFLSAKPFESELVFVNDGSRDRTLALIDELREKARQFPMIHFSTYTWDSNRGKGAAVREGLLHAAGKFCLICDADLSTPIEDIDRLLPYKDSFDIVIGSRRVPGAEILTWQPWYRVVMGKCFSLLSSALLSVPVHDFTCGFKLIRGEVGQRLAARMSMDRWGYDSELLKLAVVQNFKIKEVGVRWAHDGGSKVRLGLDIFRSAAELGRIWWNGVCGIYR